MRHLENMVICSKILRHFVSKVSSMKKKNSYPIYVIRGFSAENEFLIDEYLHLKDSYQEV